MIGVGGNGVDSYPDEEKGLYAIVLDSAQSYLPRQQPRKVLNVEVQSSNEDKKSTLEVDLEPLPSHLRYAFLGLNSTFFIISAKLDDTEIEKLLEVLKRHKGVIDSSIDDLKELSSFPMHGSHPS